MNLGNQKDCAWIRERIDSFIDGELTTAEQSILESHTKGCFACRHELELATNVLSEIRSLPKKKFSDALTARVFEQIEDASGGKERPRRPAGWFGGLWRSGTLRPALVGVFVLLVVVSTIVIDRFNPPDDRVSPEELAEAEAALKWTFTYLNDVNRRTGIVVRDDVIETRIVRPVQRAMRSALGDEQTPTPKPNGGSI